MKIAAYCRVSTDREDQTNSFQAQQRYFRAWVKENPQWELYDIYADEGLSGTSIRGRVAFQQMMEDARNGKFQRILTKEVSRFSRNILDTLQYTRELKQIGITVEFVTDGIRTDQGDGELRLAIMAAMAQEESRRTSSRVTWGQTRQMEKGVVFGRSLLGYKVQNGKITIEPEEADLVRLIFTQYADGIRTGKLVHWLNDQGYHTIRGGVWTSSNVLKILKNEKYVGDLVQKKTYTPDYLTHRKQANHGQVPYIIIQDHHQAIISRSLWEQVQNRLQKNNKHKKKKEERKL